MTYPDLSLISLGNIQPFGNGYRLAYGRQCLAAAGRGKFTNFLVNKK
ncbi:hypothetical protein NIES2134_116610 [Thermostichus vulcanus NIES-2134]|nr:hypothetical protein NIES2134_116610 [Thermostichus vulcanus NIES-2134]